MKKPELQISNDEFNLLLRNAQKERWWQVLVQVTTQRRDMLSNEVFLGRYDDNDKKEQRTKGEVMGLNWLLNIALKGELMSEKSEEERRGSGR